jgi:hypothetical protein
MSFSTFNTFNTTLSSFKNIVDVIEQYKNALAVYDYGSYNTSTSIWSNKLSNPLDVSFSNGATKSQVLGSTPSPINGSTATFGSINGGRDSVANFIQTAIPSTSKWAIFIVSRIPPGQDVFFSSITGNMTIGQFNDNLTGLLFYNNQELTLNTTKRLFANIWNVSSTYVDENNIIQFHVNGKSFIDTNKGINPYTNVGILSGLGLNTGFYKCSFEIGEIIIFNTGISATNITSIETYLLSKYGIAKAV